ncbi:pyruvate phosphate dikinase-like enzyme [Ulvibacter sp. MAR_2010_11]|uniref:PEP/pyruvate-binding domain-containing protein n=1 Tax=Ulvibacter sp. MAR_2010_11 TaxID=1250229 RepID=UPI000C2C18BC|nr:PEP/pyruvate-binding domain-containing protein [Ulvibacter sp. MAR_2010_11]PKA83830.1 pyruvate phosphate dikinase-like enzyme [Ulvibacter sp. MAR_2010_11]
MKNYTFLISLFLLGAFTNTFSQKLSNEYIKEQIVVYKNDLRGPYKDIRWFCTDGSIRQPKDPCPQNIGPGVQHARYKESVENLGKRNHIFLGQILAYTKSETLWDPSNNHSRLKQYQLGKYLGSVDNGWILEKAQFYRGALQSEDEEKAGIDFYKWLLSKDNELEQKFFLIRQSLKDVPHSGDDNLAQLMRSQSKVISDIYPAFMDLRIKIHGQPDLGDIEKVKKFKSSHGTKASSNVSKQLDELIVTMTQFYTPFDIPSLLKKNSNLKGTPLGNSIETYIVKNNNETNPAVLIPETARLLQEIRIGILTEKRATARLQLLDISLKLEEIIFKTEPQWVPTTLQQLLQKVYFLGMGTAGAGYIEQWEWQQLKKVLKPSENNNTLGQLTAVLDAARSEVEWSAAMVKANYQDVVNEYTVFEPQAYAFIDDKIRGSIALHLGKSVGQLGDFIATESSLTNKVLSIPNQSSIRGLNPGYAFGELVVVSGSSEEIEVSSNKIYVFERPPSDLKPVAGIATVAEGNLVSHVQLLARNLGIPNAALSDENLRSLQQYNGKRVFYAVSNKGNVIIKLEADMTSEEKALFTKKERKEEKIAVPIEKIRLDQNKVLNLRDVDASDSGTTCGPKAANLGQLKQMFPENVVEGLVIPFGIFREHMDQTMPGQNKTYWNFLNDMFTEAEKMRSRNIPDAEVENYQLRELETLRAAIKKMPLKASFVSQMEEGFKTILGKPIGQIPVFLRSDTNMEDLKDFTGAGLNLTLFNVAARDKILEGIKDVWASPYTERSFKWRQKYLSNPENVFPSILVIPSVDVDYSGVLITKGISSGDANDLTVAFSRGAGGAVDGQSAEAYLIRMDESYELLAPAREPFYNRLPLTGGTSKQAATFETRILSEADIKQICELAEKIRELLPQVHEGYNGAYDVELGFKDGKLWLFQVRPFVENKKALSSGYLESITPTTDTKKEISLSTKI